MRLHPIGTGPFKFVEFKANEHIKVAKNPNYWKQGRPFLDAIEYTIITVRSTAVLAFTAGEIDLTSLYPISPVAGCSRTSLPKAPNAKCQFVALSNNTINMIVTAGAPPFDRSPSCEKGMALALDRRAFNTILAEGKSMIGAVMLPGPEGKWSMPDGELAVRLRSDLAKNQAEALRIMEGLGYSATNPLKVKVSTRNIPLYRDPAVIFIDQMKKIHIEGELDVVNSTIWHAKVQRKGLGLNTTGVGVDDPDVNLVENYTCKSDRNYTGYCNEEVDKLIFARSREVDPEKQQRADPVGGGAQDRRRCGPPDHPAQPRGHLLAAVRERRHQPQQLALQAAGGWRMPGSTSRVPATAAGLAASVRRPRQRLELGERTA